MISESHSQLISQAIARVQEVMSELDTTTHECSSCGLQKATDYDELQIHRKLASVVHKLRRTEGEIRSKAT